LSYMKPSVWHDFGVIIIPSIQVDVSIVRINDESMIVFKVENIVRNIKRIRTNICDNGYARIRNSMQKVKDVLCYCYELKSIDY